MKYLKLIRIKHYVKNFLILIPFFFAGELFNITLLPNVALGFISFCALSSIIYIINDIKDAPLDRNHSTKCKRPIASGEIKVGNAVKIGVILLGICIFCNFMTKASWISWIIMALYFIVNISYSMYLKNVPIIDIFLLTSGFILRVLYGAVITNIEISNWLYLSIMAISFYLSLGKRRNELKKSQGNETRKVLEFYNFNFLDKFMYVCLAVFIIFYSLWCVSISQTNTFGKNIVLTIPALVLFLMKYSLNVENENNDGDPVEVIFKDKWLIGLAVLIAIMFVLIIYI